MKFESEPLDSQEFNGLRLQVENADMHKWTPPLIEDWFTRKMRIATQADVDLLVRKAALLSRMLAAAHTVASEYEQVRRLDNLPPGHI